MIGDIVDTSSVKKTTIDSLVSLLLPHLQVIDTVFAVSIAGESGSGKSVIAHALGLSLGDRGFKTVLLQQDDYFAWPPKTNSRMRREDSEGIHPLLQYSTDPPGDQQRFTGTEKSPSPRRV